jgi:hypothetical protein
VNERISNLEKRTLKILYKRYKSYHKIEPILAEDLFRLLEIKDGEHVGLLNSSKYLSMKLVGTHEAFIINDEGIRYMESRPKWYESFINWIFKIVGLLK